MRGGFIEISELALKEWENWAFSEEKDLDDDEGDSDDDGGHPGDVRQGERVVAEEPAGGGGGRKI